MKKEYVLTLEITDIDPYEDEEKNEFEAQSPVERLALQLQTNEQLTEESEFVKAEIEEHFAGKLGFDNVKVAKIQLFIHE